MLKMKAAIAAVALACATPAMADDYLAVTPSGMAETVFSETPAEVIGKLSSRCIDAHWTVIASSATELVCEAPMSFGQSLLGQMLMGNSYSTPPRQFFRFNVADIGGVSRVQASGWMELQMAFGQTKRTDFAGAPFQNNIMAFMTSAGGAYPVGTSFPNHAIIGVKGDDYRAGKFIDLRITSIEPESPAEKAGVLRNDLLSKIAGRRFKNLGDYLDATAKAAKTPTYEIEIIRGGKPLQLRVERAFRPTITENVKPRSSTAASPVAPASTTQPASVADEILKLSKLKEQGLITEAEFELQKKKLLGGN